jgi:DNA-binding response OmpR family regulator
VTSAAHLAGESDELDDGARPRSGVGRAGFEHRLLLLVADPDDNVAEQFAVDFLNHGIDTHLCRDGAEALVALGRHPFDAVLAAANLPILPGPRLVEAFRKHRPHLPIVIGAAQSDAELAMEALAAGATAAVARPYRPPELIPLLRATFPEVSLGDLPAVLRVGTLYLDAGSHEVRFNGVPITLPPREFDLLRYLMANADRVVTPSQIREHVWGLGSRDGSNTLVVHMRRIRQRLGDNPRKPRLIQTIRGLGYRLVLPDS